VERRKASYAERAALAELDAAVRRNPNQTQNLLIVLALLFGIGIPVIRWIGPPAHDYAVDRHIAYCVSLKPSEWADCLYPPENELRD
jgi:hypothetical protein